MQIPAEAAVKPFEDAALGSLLVGRFSDDRPTFVAVRTEHKDITGDPTACMAILSSWVESQERPYLKAPPVGSTKVLDLGRDWSIEVSIDETTPAFTDHGYKVLIRSGANFYVRLDQVGFLDVASGGVVENLPADLGVASWFAFAIYLPQPGRDGPGAEIFKWPHESGDRASWR